ncbi:unnamed protein product [Nezara viridula]|uniref:Uncharacterized protein n=1 Tax=Nezara viridula TaxID=85310 RepID=A0A9P0HIJ0_NEZVI|nr:unnamed protein product [Nezara viridula]
MDNNRSYPDSYYNYGEYNEYQNYRQPSSSRNENLLPKETVLKASDGNKSYYRGQENFQDSYSEDQSWNTQTRRVPNPSYSMFPSSHKKNLSHSVADSQLRNNLPQTRDLPIKGILVGGHNGNNLEGMHRNNISEQGMTQERKETNQRRVKTPQSNYRLPPYRDNENLMATLCGGEPVIDMDDSQYYLINDRKLGPDNDKNFYDDYNEQTDDEISYKEGNVYDYNATDNAYESSIRDMAMFDPRERANKQFPKPMHGNSHCEKPESSPYSNNDDYYMVQQRNTPSSSQGYNQSRLQNLNRNRTLMHSPSNRQEMYKQLATEKLNETFNELKNAGLNEKNEEYKPQRQDSFAGMDRYKYQDLINENTKRSAMMSHLNKYKTSNDNEQINRRLYYPLSKTQDASCNTNRKIQMGPEELKSKNSSQGEPGSFVHMHKEYQNCPSVPGCCVDVYSNYRKEKIPDSM